MCASRTELLHEARAAIEGLPGIKVRSVSHSADARESSAVDLDLQVEIKGRPVRVLIVTRAQGYPRDIREAVWKLEQISGANKEDSSRSDARDEPVVCMVVAPAISQKGRELLRQEGFGYWDSGGSIYIELPWAVFFIDRPQPKGAERPIRTIYRGRTTRVLHAMLLDPARHWQVRELAERAEVSAYTVHQVLTFLEKQLWVEKHGSGPNTLRVLRDPGALLDAWAEAHALEKYTFHRFYLWSQSQAALRRRLIGVLNDLEADYALTLGSGSELIAPYATRTDRLTLLVQDTREVDQVVREMNLAPVETGENIAFLVTHDHSPLMFRQQVENMFVASNIQLYLDLWAWPKRGKEQARHLRKQMLTF